MTRIHNSAAHTRAQRAIAGTLLLPMVAGFLCTGTRLTAAPSTGGSYSLIGTVGAGPTMASGGNYSLRVIVGSSSGGVHLANAFPPGGGPGDHLEGGGGGTPLPDEVVLDISWTNSGELVLSWKPTATGFVLESSATIGAESQWQRVSPDPIGTAYLVTADQPNRFYRLRKP